MKYAFFVGITLLVHVHPARSGGEVDGADGAPTDGVSEVPIAEVWSNRIPGTRDIFELEPNAPPHIMKFRREFRSIRHGGETLTQQIDERLGPRRSREWWEWRNKNWENESKDSPLEPMKMFAVLGHGKAALVAAHGVLVKREEPQHVFSRDDDITVVFFSHRSEEIQLRRILRNDNELTIVYQFVLPNEDCAVNPMSGDVHLALIPVSSVQPKEMFVNLRRIPSEGARNEQTLQDPVCPEEAIENKVSRPFRVMIR